MRYLFLILNILWFTTIHSQDFLRSNYQRSPLYGHGITFTISNCPKPIEGTFYEQEVANRSKHVYSQNVTFDVLEFSNHKSYIYVDLINASDSFQMKMITNTDTFIFNKEKLAYWNVQLGEEVFETKYRKGWLQLDSQSISYNIDSIQTKKYFADNLLALKPTSKIEIILSNNSIKDSFRVICFSIDDNPKNYSLHEILYLPKIKPLFVINENDKTVSYKDYYAYTSRCQFIGLGDLRSFLFYKLKDPKIYRMNMKKIIATYFHY
jgi:hypothetical protein